MHTLEPLPQVSGTYLQALYETWQSDPGGVDASWQRYFDEMEQSPVSGISGGTSKEVAVVKLIIAYRNRGHLLANTNPIRERRKHKTDLELAYFGLTDDDLGLEFDAGKDIKIGRATLRQILEHLKKTYCGTIGSEFRYIRDEKLRQWLYDEMETIGNKPTYPAEERLHILAKINQAVTFEQFLHTKYVGKKRFALEGIESIIPALDAAIREGAKLGLREVVLGMAHRGRLNVLVNIFGKRYEDMLAEFEGHTGNGYEEDGDVKYHLGQSSDIQTIDGHEVHMSLVPNPSHLEAVNPVIEGLVHGKIHQLYSGDERAIAPVLIHGDSSLGGQGIIYEGAQISKVAGYSNGGTVHIVLNNQVGFTTNYMESRTSVYCTDIGRVTESPVFHVNADDPEAVVHAVQMAMKIRQKFGVDTFVDVVGYRRYGHNEGDEPRFTQPQLYRIIDQHPNVLTLYGNRLVTEQVLSREALQKMIQDFFELLQKKLDHVRTAKLVPQVNTLARLWSGLRKATGEDFEKSVPTAVHRDVLDSILKAMVTIPEGFHLFGKMKKILEQRQDSWAAGKIDWAMAEQLSWGSLLLEGHPVRLSGQDSQRGTFSHRHAVIKDYETETPFIPLTQLGNGQSRFTVLNSILSEYCVLGFEYGHSMATPRGLTMWEAQFGDFANGAQIIIDQFISSSEAKWQRMSGLVMLLPHGYEGQGPEHTSARPERFLQAAAGQNWYICNITTPANLFHAFRRQVKSPFRKPLVIFSPKSLLRHPRVVSKVDELVQGHFQEILLDDTVKPEAVTRVICCSGKVYYDLLEAREKNGRGDVALIRFEQLYPLPEGQLSDLRRRYAKAKDWVWLQEEPENMGAWTHLRRVLPNWPFRLMSRPEAASPATAFLSVHEKNQARLVEAAFA